MNAINPGTVLEAKLTDLDSSILQGYRYLVVNKLGNDKHRLNTLGNGKYLLVGIRLKDAVPGQWINEFSERFLQSPYFTELNHINVESRKYRPGKDDLLEIYPELGNYL